MADDQLPDDLYYVNGLNGSTGAYLEEPLTPQQIGDAAQDLVKRQEDKARDDLLRDKANRLSDSSMAPVFGVDVRKLEETGWAVLFAQGADPGIKRELQPLLDYRHKKAGDLFKVYEDDKGYQPGDTWEEFCRRHRISVGQANPKQMPYYLLIVGDPETIPYEFQYAVDVDRAVGRIHFDRLDDYACYAQSVVNAGEQSLQLPRRVTFFGTSNLDDRATKSSSQDLIAPLAEELAGTLGQQKWQLDTIRPADAIKSRLSRLLGSTETPALLFTATHGAAWNSDDPYYQQHQGALVTQDWPGPNEWQKRLKDDFLFSAADVGDDAQLWGMIAVFFACFSAGTPSQSDFFHLKEYKPEEQLHLAKQALLAPLPKRLLSHPRGGALAVAGHVERAWTTSFKRPDVSGPDSRDLEAFQQLTSLLMRGYPIGAALENMNSRYALLSTELTGSLYNVMYRGMTYTDQHKESVARLWTANNDARNYVIVGDPAVCLPVSDTQTAVAPHPTLPAVVAVSSNQGAAGSQAPNPPAAAITAPPQARVAEPAPGAPQTRAPSAGPVASTAAAESMYIPIIATDAGDDSPKTDGDRPKIDPVVLEAWRDHVKSGYRHNDEMFRRTLNAYLGPYYTTVWMNGILFAVGILSFLGSVGLSIAFKQPLFALAFGGLSVAAFLSYFLSRPMRSLEENLEFITWLGAIYNTYWTRLVCANNPSTMQQDIQAATTDTISEIEHLIDKHAELSRKRPSAKEPRAAANARQ